MSKNRPIILKKVNVHNLKNVDLELPSHELIVFTGVSGSGKSSMAFDTLYVEGQRRYIESLSTYARRYLGELAKPDLEEASGLSPTISIEQKSAGKNPRSTVGTMTEIYDYLRVLFARIATPHCPVSGEAVQTQSKERIIRTIQGLPKVKAAFLAPFARGKKGEFKDDFSLMVKRGFTRARVDQRFVDLSEEVSLDKNVSHDIDIVIDRITISDENHSRIAEAIISGLEAGNGVLVLLDLDTNEERLFSTSAYSPKSGLSYPSLEPQDFSFNSPTGMCETCHGLGATLEFDLDLILDPEKSLREDPISIASSFQTVRYGNIYKNLADIYGFSVDTPWKKLSEKAKKILLYGVDKKWIQMHFVHPTRGISWSEYIHWKGILNEAKDRFSEAKSELYRKKQSSLMKEEVCPSCHGSRLKPYPAAALLKGKKIDEIASMTIEETLDFFQKLKLDPQELKIADELLKEIKERLKFLLDVGLHYLTLSRTSPTLSGGEAQRVRLASQVGSGLVGVTYVLDEPSIGLHPRDNKKLVQTLKNLRDSGNTVVVVEHDHETILAADRVVDFGPGPGRQGGEIVFNGPVDKLLLDKKSVTGAYLSGREEIDVPEVRRKPQKEKLTILGASHHNLKEIDVSFPLGVFIAVTGVSGSGKSSLISDTLYPALSNALHHGEHKVGAYKKIEGLENIDKVIAIDQSPIGRNPRSNPSTYIKIFDEIRDLFSQLPEAQAKGFLPSRFSFNRKEGSCPVCNGMGMVKVDMDFMEDEWVVCQTCKSKRFDEETLSITYKGKSIYDVLETTVGDALKFFENIPHLKKKLEVVSRVGMSYITLGQPSTTLSGGEAQRIKLAKELVRPGSGNTFYILDEPTTGLHFQDIKALLSVLHELVEKGNTVLVIEHNMDVVKTADWIIDLGPTGGAGGGKIVATGTPEKIASLKTPTGVALKEVFSKIEYKPPKKETKERRFIESIKVRGASQNNLKHLNVTIPRGEITIFTGPSGSGKSSLAFETIYAEGQRRYVESLSPYARQFVEQMPKPIVTEVEGLSPSIAIEQKASSGNPRSTVGTMTETYDYLRILFAQAGIAYCPETGERIQSITKDYVVDRILEYPTGSLVYIFSPIDLEKNEKFEDFLKKVARLGYLRIRLNKEIYELDGEIPFDRKRKNEIEILVDRFKLSSEIRERLFEAVENGAKLGQNKIIATVDEKEIFFNLSFAVEKTGKSYPPITPHTFSFNHILGMCPDCQGLGFQYGANLTKNPLIMNLSFGTFLRILFSEPAHEVLQLFFKKEGIDPTRALKDFSSDKLNLLLNGAPDDRVIESKRGFSFRWLGIQPVLIKAAKSGKPEIRASLIPLLEEIECPSCHGSRLNPLARNVKLNGHTMATLTKLPSKKVREFMEGIKLEKRLQKLLEEVIKQLKSRLDFLLEVGLHYLSLDRKAPTLSNGEAQRIRLARQLGSSLTGVLYVLDEPTIGLHPKDTEMLNRALHKLKDLGNTLLIVEHDRETIREADNILDFGPGAGVHGGHITAQGSFKEILKNPKSLTGAYLSGKKEIPLREKRRKPKAFFNVENIKAHNLKNLTLNFPMGVMTCLTGVSGSGKSTLMHGVIRPEIEKKLSKKEPFDKMIVIDQNPIGHTVRSDVGTYVDVLPILREFYASLGGSRTKGLLPRHFSYNHRKGMCTHCYGLGYKKIEMLFLPAVKVTCEECQGLRLNPVSLKVEYQGKNFGQILGLTVEEARRFFEILPKANRIFDTLISVGLGYVKLGQEMASLSGGEAQRIKLSKELSKRGTGKTLYLLDEPTTGQHMEDVLKLNDLLQKLVDKGNTMIIIEHDLDIIKNADYVFDLGPEAGEEGGYLVCEGTPEKIAKSKQSYTGQFLKDVLNSD